ncbi:MAG: hypothetical protein ACOX4M_02270 [Acetivibrionales bacterium]|jgi:hypothetical protein
MNRTGKVLGVILIVLGAAVLLDNVGLIDLFGDILSIGRLWPSLFFILPGLLFHAGYFSGSGRNPGLLVPGGILLVLGITFQINMLFGGWDITWPMYIFSVAFGLFELYIFGSREKGLLIPIGILTGLSFIFFVSFSLKKLLSFNTQPFAVPLLLIGIGLIILLGGKRNK